MVINIMHKNLMGGSVPPPDKGPASTGNKSFREIFDELLAADGMNEGRLAEVNKPGSVVTAKMQKKVEAAVNWLARYLGIKPALLLAVFDEIGINPDDMADEMKFMVIINSIAEYFGLDEEQKKEITREMGGILGFSF